MLALASEPQTTSPQTVRIQRRFLIVIQISAVVMNWSAGESDALRAIFFASRTVPLSWFPAGRKAKREPPTPPCRRSAPGRFLVNLCPVVRRVLAVSSEKFVSADA